MGYDCRTPSCPRGCLNGGRCIRPNQCQCANGYQGQRCETPVCSPSCHNNGQCIQPNVCKCPTGYAPPTCADPICAPECVHGDCVAPGTCRCIHSYYGSLCEHRRCTKNIPAPSHGTAVCSEVEKTRAQKCRLACQEGFGLSVQEFVYQCANTGDWVPSADKVPPCEMDIPIEVGGIVFRTLEPTDLQLPVACNDLSDEQREILKSIVRAAILAEDVTESDIKVEIICDKRRKRSKPGATGVEVEISFHVQNKGGDDIETTKEKAKAVQQFVCSTSLENLSLKDVKFHEVLDSMREGPIEFSCPIPDGQILLESDRPVCRNCSAGTFLEIDYETSRASCVACPLHTYQSESGHSDCTPCPVGRGTAREGATSVSECKEALCEAGSFGEGGTAPCKPCPLDTYQSLPGEDECLPCSSESKTTSSGATLCKGMEKCEPGEVSLTGLKPCEPCPRGTYQVEAGRTVCIRCSTDFTVAEGSASKDACVFKEDVCQPGHAFPEEVNKCVPCPKGSYQADYGQPTCVPCPKGTTTEGEGNASMLACSLEEDDDEAEEELEEELEEDSAKVKKEKNRFNEP